MSRHRGSGGYGRSGKSHGKPAVGDKAREVLETMDEDNPVIKMFLEYRKELDDKHDRYEKIVKLSRDITIENKRIIFLLHTINTDIEEKKQPVLDEAGSRLKQTTDKSFRAIALLLKGLDAYQYHRAYTSGVQEFVEAYVFHQFLAGHVCFDPWAALNAHFQYETEGEDGGEKEAFGLLFPQSDYILGIADFTGELMRRCINNLGMGNVADCFRICLFVKNLHTGFAGLISPNNKELSRKCFVLRQSLAKMELVCYNLQIRGSEIPKHMLACVIESGPPNSGEMNNDDDEGYY